MALLKALLTKEEYEQLPQNMKDMKLYVDAGEGKYKLDSDHEDVTGLKNSVAAARKERQDAETRLNDYQKLGDPQKIAQAMTELTAAKAKEAEMQATYEREIESVKHQSAAQIDALKRQHADDIKAREEKISQRDTDIQRLVVDNQIAAALGMEEVGGNPRVLLYPMRSRVRAVRDEKTGEYKVQVMGADGNQMYVDGQPATVKDLALELRKDPDYAPNFKSLAKGGGGTPPSGAAAGGGGTRTLTKTDSAGMSASLEDIAKGKVLVEG